MIEAIVAGAGGLAAFDFDNIAATYRALRIELYGRPDRDSGYDFLNCRVNGDSGTTYEWCTWVQQSDTSPANVRGLGAALWRVGYFVAGQSTTATTATSD
jgi:hypothetical protein